MTLREGSTLPCRGPGPAHTGEQDGGPSQDRGDCRKSSWESPAVSGQSSRHPRALGSRGSRPGQEAQPGLGMSPQLTLLLFPVGSVALCPLCRRPSSPASCRLPPAQAQVGVGWGQGRLANAGGTPPSTCRSFLSSQQAALVPSGDFSGTCPHPQSHYESVSASPATARGSLGVGPSQKAHKAGCLPPGSPGRGGCVMVGCPLPASAEPVHGS